MGEDSEPFVSLSRSSVYPEFDSGSLFFPVTLSCLSGIF